MTDPVILDPKALDRLREWGGEKLLGQMVRIFIENSPTRMEQIRNGGSDGDLKEAERGAHSLKSSAANLGLEAFRAVAADMEARAAKGDLASVRAILPDLEATYEQGLEAVKSVERGLSE